MYVPLTRPHMFQDGQVFELSTNPAARGGVTLHSMMRMKKMIETEKLKPVCPPLGDYNCLLYK